MRISDSTLIEVPQIYTTSNHFNQLFELWATISQIPDRSLNISFSFRNCKFLGHNGVAFLGALARWIEFRGGNYTFDWDTLRPNILVNLGQNGFLNHFGHTQEPWPGNSIPYCAHQQQDKSTIHTYLCDQWLGRGWVDVSPALQNQIIGKVVELYNNAFQHSDSPIGVVSCGQRYHNRGRLHLSLIDMGRGIPNTVRSLPKHTDLSSIEAMEWAFIPGNTTMSGLSCGLGLSVLHDFLQENQGELKIFSNDAYWRIKSGKIECSQQKINFSGTFVNLELRCDQPALPVTP
jgi:hypothetical protein